VINGRFQLALFWRFSITVVSASSISLATDYWLLAAVPVPLFSRHSPLATRHSPPAIRPTDSEFGDPELAPLCRRHMLRNATFFGFFEILENQVSTQVIN